MQRKSARMKYGLRFVAACLLISLVGGLLPPDRAGALSSAAQQSLNLLDNPSFEGDFEILCSFPGGKPWIAVPCDGPVPSYPRQTVRWLKAGRGGGSPPMKIVRAKDYYDTFPNYCGPQAPGDVWPGICQSFAIRALRRKTRRASAAGKTRRSISRSGAYMKAECIKW